MPWTPAALVPFIVSLAFAAGLNVYAVVLLVGLAGRLRWAELPIGLHGLESAWVLGAATLLFAVHFIVDKVPGLDVIWNALHTFLRIPAAVLLAFAASATLSTEQRLLVTCVSAVVALVAHGSTLVCDLQV